MPASSTAAPRRLPALRDLRVSAKLFAGFGVVSLLLLGVGGTGLLELTAARQRLEGMYQDSTQAIAHLGEVRGDVHSARALAGKLILHTHLTDVNEVETEIKRLDEDIDTTWALYAATGDAGRGFAVVAGEVKQLAQETARATKDISDRVAAIQTDSDAAVAAIAEIEAVIDQINATQSAIAAAVEEQTAVTSEMGRNVNEVADSSTDITSNVSEVAQAAAETTEAAGNTARAADELAEIARDLESNLAMFRY
jgi:chromosome segregation ATPase